MFKDMWRSYAEESVFTVESKGAVSATAGVLRARVLPGLNMTLVEGLDSNPDNVVGAAEFFYLSSSTGAPKSVPMLVRITRVPAGVTVTVHSNSPLVNTALETTLRFLLDPPKH